MDINAIKSKLNGLVSALESAEDTDAPDSVLDGLRGQIEDASIALADAEEELCGEFVPNLI